MVRTGVAAMRRNRLCAIRCQRCGNRSRRWEITYIDWRTLPVMQDDPEIPRFSWTATQAKWCFRCARQSRAHLIRRKFVKVQASFERLMNATLYGET